MALQMNPNGRLWRVAGGLAIAHVVIAFTGAALEKSPEIGATASTREAAFAHSSISTVLAGGYLDYLGELAFLAAALLIAQLLRGRDVLPRWLSSCIGATAVASTVIVIGVASPAGAAAVYDGHQGIGLDVLTVVNDVRNFAFFLYVGVLGAFALAVAGAIRVSGLLPRWLSYTGFAVGTLCLISPALQSVWSAVNSAILLWFVWLVALSAVALRGQRAAVVPTDDIVTV